METVINIACLLWKINKKDLLKQGRATTQQLIYLVSIFFVLNKKYKIDEIAIHLHRDRTSLYHYVKLLRPSNQFFLFEPYIFELEQRIKKIL